VQIARTSRPTPTAETGGERREIIGRFPQCRGRLDRHAPFGRAAADYGARSVVLALRSLAKNLAGVPGRKTLILFTAGFPLNSEIRRR